MNRIMRTVLNYTWELPQTLLGEMILMFGRIFDINWETKNYEDARLHKSDIRWGVSLGRHIIVSVYAGERIVRHEYGHTKQSLFLGPLYLIIIGIPSIVMNIISRFNYSYGDGVFSANYYERWPENWADKLGGIRR